jgi:uncharacterized protein YeaO (DUF488 family)
MIKIKRAYDPVESSDGHRILIDRMWPRGVKKEDLALEEWAREICPSKDLCSSFDSSPEEWKRYQAEYKWELQNESAKRKLAFLSRLSKESNITLIYSSRDREHNNAIILKELLDQNS